MRRSWPSPHLRRCIVAVTRQRKPSSRFYSITGVTGSRHNHNNNADPAAADEAFAETLSRRTAGSPVGAGFGRNVRDRWLPSAQPASLTGLEYRHTPVPRTVAVIGAPFTWGQTHGGTDVSPALLRDAGLLPMLAQLGWQTHEVPDLSFDDATTPVMETYFGVEDSTAVDDRFVGNALNSRVVGQGNQKICQAVSEALRQNQFPLTLGGDHSIALGTLAAVLQHRPETGVIWVDAHADINTPWVSTSGNMHGMPLGLLVDGVRPVITDPLDPNRIPGLDWLLLNPHRPVLPPDSLVYVGLRDVDPAEREVIHRLGIHAYTMYEIDKYGIGTVMEMALDHLLAKNPHRPLHLSYDIDAVDPMLAPATGTTVRGGLTYREAHYVAEATARTGNLASAEIVELNPSLSPGIGAHATIDLGLQLVTSLMGKSIV